MATRTLPTDLTAAQLRDLLDYDPQTGAFTWRRTGQGRRLNCQAGEIGTNGYIRITIKSQRYLAHRLAWLYVHGEWPVGDLDHRDRDRSNNRIENLRPSTASQNAANRKVYASNKAGLKGVSTLSDRRKRYLATIYKDGKQIPLGSFYTPEEAHQAYCAAAAKLFGEYARAR